jgi:uncharacterized OB-fold protein
VVNEGTDRTAPALPPPSPAKYVDRALDDVAREFYRRLADGRAPATTRCPACEETRFPPRDRCPACGGEVEWVELPRRGTLHAFTTQETAVRFAAPAVLALVELGDVVVPAIAETAYDELAIGDEVEVEGMAVPELGLTLLRAIKPASAGS